MPVLPFLSFWSSVRVAAKLVTQSSHRKLGSAALLCLLAMLASAPASAVTHNVTHSAKIHKSRHSALNPIPHWRFSSYAPRMYPGSHDMLVNEKAELIRYEVSQVLVPVNETEALKLAADLPESRRYCRPWTRDFLQDFTQAYYEHFHTPLQVNSLVRTMEQQGQLRRHNRYAAPEWGDTASTHLTGVTFDLSRRGLTVEQYAWILVYMLPLKESGMIDPIEESQPVLHVVVFEKYSDHLDKKNNWSEANEPTEASLSAGVGASQP